MTDFEKKKWFKISNTIAMYISILVGIACMYYYIGVILVAYGEANYSVLIMLGIILILFGYWWHWWYPQTVRACSTKDNEQNSYHQYILELLEKQSSGNEILVSEKFALWSESKQVIKLCNLFGGVAVCIGILDLILK